MSNSICPNCGYELVLLERRRKYKCALCSKLFPQRKIKNKGFRNWNKVQKQLDFQKYEQERKEELSKIKELRKHIKLLFNGIPVKIDKREYWRKYIAKNKPKREDWIKENKPNKTYLVKIKHRLHHYRQRQKRLALLYLKSYKEKLCTYEIFKSPPTFLHSELLLKTISLKMKICF